MRLSMRKVRKILRLKFDGGQTNRRTTLGQSAIQISAKAVQDIGTRKRAAVIANSRCPAKSVRSPPRH